MAQQPLLVLQAVDVRRATATGVSRATTIATMTIPQVRFISGEHNPGGGVGAVNFMKRRIEALEPAFSVKGIDREVFRGMGVRDIWSFASAFTEETGSVSRVLPARGVIEGAVASWEPDESDPADLQGCNHVFSEVTHFEFTLGEEELIYYDFFERELRTSGAEGALTAEIQRALGV